MRLKSFFSATALILLITSCSGQEAASQSGAFAEVKTLVEKKEFDKAIEQLNGAIEKDADQPLAWFLRGLSKAGKGEHETALADYDEAVNRLGSHSEIADTAKARMFLYRGLSRFALNQNDPAIADFTEALNRGYVNRSEALAYRGVCYGRKEDFGNVFKDLNEAISLDPKNHYAITNRGYYNSLVGDNAAAIKDHTMAIALKPDDKVSYLNRGYTYLQDGNAQQALSDFEKSYAIDSLYMGAIVYIGIAHTNMGHNAEALPWFNKVIPMDPDNPTLYYYRGTCLANLGRTEDGCVDLKRAFEGGESNAGPMIERYCR